MSTESTEKALKRLGGSNFFNDFSFSYIFQVSEMKPPVKVDENHGGNMYAGTTWAVH